MADFILTKKAEEYFDSIGLYSLEGWGLHKAESYVSNLDACFCRLADNVFLGQV